MAKTTPVRWWRDDGTRYQSRPPYLAPPVDVDVDAAKWAIELLSGLNDMAPMFERLKTLEREWYSMAVPLDLLFGDGR